MQRNVLVVGDHRQTLAVVRSLARAGWRVIVGQHGDSFSTHSRFAAGSLPLPAAAKGQQLRAAVASVPDIECVFPVGEAEMIALLDLELPNVHIAMPPASIVRTCLDKPESYAIAAACGIPLGAAEVVADLPGLLAAAARIGYPVAVKCPDSTRLLGGQKAMRCNDESDLHRLAGAGFPLVVQRWLDGARHNCQFVAQGGRIVAYFEQRVLRADGIANSGFGIEGISVAPNPTLYAHCESLVARLDYDGPGCVQFLVADDGDHLFLELNPRLDATCELAVHCGVDLPRLALDGSGAPLDYRVGRRYHWLLGDIRHVSAMLKRGELGRRDLPRAIAGVLTAHWRADCHLTWRWGDPLPSFVLYTHALFTGGRSTMHAVVSQ